MVNTVNVERRIVTLRHLRICISEKHVCDSEDVCFRRTESPSWFQELHCRWCITKIRSMTTGASRLFLLVLPRGVYSEIPMAPNATGTHFFLGGGLIIGLILNWNIYKSVYTKMVYYNWQMSFPCHNTLKSMPADASPHATLHGELTTATSMEENGGKRNDGLRE